MLVVLTVSGCSKQEQGAQAQQPERESQEHVTAPQTPPEKAGFVAHQPVKEQIRIASCVKLSNQYRWGEPSPGYPIEVAEAFLLDHSVPDLPELTPWLDTNNVAWLYQDVVCLFCHVFPDQIKINLSDINFVDQDVECIQHGRPAHTGSRSVYRRMVNFFTVEGCYSITLWLDADGKILTSRRGF